MNVLIKHTQRSAFEDTIRKLENSQQCAKPIRRLAPFLDQNGIIRVGGRLSNSQLSFNAKHPALLPRSHRFSQLVIEHAHRVHLHPPFFVAAKLLDLIPAKGYPFGDRQL
jgi:hypothetical protein